MTTWSQRLLMQGREEGHQTGLQTGRQEGRQEGEAAVLLRLLTRRFGPLGAPMTEKIRQATTAELEQWADRVLEARSLEEVLFVQAKEAISSEPSMKELLKQSEEKSIDRYIKISGEENFREIFAKELLAAKEIYQGISAHGRVPDNHWQFFHDSYVEGQQIITWAEIESTRPLALDHRDIRNSITYYMRNSIRAMYEIFIENPIKDKEGNILNLEEISEKYPDVFQWLAYGVCAKYKKDLSVLRTRHRYSEDEDILSFFQIKKLLKITNSENYIRLLFTIRVKETTDTHWKKMAFDRSYAISMPQWR